MSAYPVLAAPKEPQAKPQTQIRRILFATDFSRESLAALPLASNMARRYHARVQVLHVIAPVPVVLPEGASYLAPDTSRAEQNIAQLLHSDVLQGLDVQWAVRLGLVGETIQDEARALAADVIVVGTHGFGGVRHFMMGSVAEELARSAPCPVITVGPHIDKRFSQPGTPEHILVPVDFSPESLDVLPYLIPLIKEFESRVTFLHVRSSKEERLPRAQSKHFINKMRALFHKHIPEGCEVRYLVETGEIAETILNVAFEKNVYMIAMGVRPKDEIGFRVRSSITYKVLASAQCPVLVSHLH